VTTREGIAVGAGGSRGRTALAVAAVLLMFVLGSLVSRLFYPDRGSVVRELSGRTMGTTWSARVVAPPGADARVAAAADSIASRLAAVNDRMSTWDPESEISRLNRHASSEPFPVSPAVADVLARARRVSEATDGAFDVTVGRLVELWGFGPGDGPGEPPDPSALAEALSHTGFRGLRLVEDGRAVVKDDPALHVDLSAIAKGYGVDRAAEALSGLGIASWAIEVGGEVRARGRKPDGTPWRIGIETPDPGGRRVLRSFALEDLAAATSGDYRNFFERDGVRYAHIVDPRTGRPVRWEGFSVTVLHGSAAIADAWATGLGVLGPRLGVEAAEREGIAVLFVVRNGPGGGYREVASAAWSSLDAGGAGSASTPARAAASSTTGSTVPGISWGQTGQPARKTTSSASVASM
jgi:FAD:protein FMN transferase